MKLSQKVFYLTLIGVLCGFMLTAGDYTTKQQTRDVIVVFKTHFDIGYTDWADNVRYNYAGPMVEGALEIVEKSHQMPEHQQFNWIIAGWPMKEMLENSKPEVKPRIEQAIRNGNFTVHGLPFTFQVDACEPESMVRSLGYSSAINRQAGLQLPIDAKQTDVPSHSWVLPTILANAGIKFLHIGCNPASPSPEVPLLFWWEGPDQSRLMTMYFEPYYGTSPAHGYMSTPCETKLARHLAKDIVNIENMTTLFDVWNIASEPGLHARTKRAMEKIHLFNEHTFGLAMSHGHGGYWAYPELGRINLTNEPYRRITGTDPEIIFVQDEVSVSANIHFEPREQYGHKYTMIITLYGDSPYIELIWSINGKPAESWPEAGWLSFPFNINEPQFRLGRPGAVVDPVTDFIKGTNMDYYFLNTGMAITESGDSGFGIMSPDVPGISLDRPGLWKYSTDFIPQKGNVFFNLYNNKWSTNFTYWVEGSWQARFYLWSFDSYSNEHAVITPSEEFLNPLLAAYTSGQPGKMPLTATGLTLSRKGLQIGAFCPNPVGEGTLLRIWEQAGKGGEVIITFPAGSTYKTAQPVNLRGEAISHPIKLENHKLIYNINPNSVLSFIIK